MLHSVVDCLDPLTRGWAVVFAGSAARLALGFVASILIARALGPSTFGVYAVLAAASNVAGAIADAGLSESGVKRVASVWPGDPPNALRRAGVFFWLRVGFAALLVLVGIRLAGPLSLHLLGLPQGEILFTLTLLGVLATALSGAVNALLQATSRFGRITLVLLANSVLTVALAALLSATGSLTIITALLLLGIGTSLAGFALGQTLLPEGWRLPLPDLAVLRSEGPPLLAFGAWLWVGGVFAMLAAQLDLLLLNRWIDAATVGVYGLALSLASKVGVVNDSLHTVLLPAASALRGERAVGSYLRLGLIRSALLGVALLPLFPLADGMIALFYGPAYAPAADLFRLLLGVALFDLFVSPVLLLAFTYDRPRLMAAADALRAGTLGALMVALVPTFGPAGAVAARLLARVAGAALVLVSLFRLRKAGADAERDSPAG